MNKVLEALLTVLALAGLFCALPNSPPVNPTIGAQQAVVADGSAPMPICRGKRCF
jgi:hypothetical protein